jgi:uncharacterized protein YfaS (alpha-2-macroglobulin family)
MPYNRSRNTVSFRVATIVVRVVSISSNVVSPGDTLQVVAQATIDGSPLANATVALWINLAGAWRRVATTTTGSDGRATLSWTVPWNIGDVRLPCNRFNMQVSVLYDTGTAYSDTFTIAFAYPTRIDNPRTSKSVYAPGETVYVYADLRYLDADGSWKPLANQTITFRLRDPAGNIIESRTGTTDANGTAYARFTAPSTAGSYSFLIEYMGHGLGAPAAVSLAGVQVSAPESIVATLSIAPLLVSSIVLVASMAVAK